MNIKEKEKRNDSKVSTAAVRKENVTAAAVSAISKKEKY